MAEEGKKISFGFSKSVKKPALKNVPPPEQKKVDYIECLDEKLIKIVGGENKKDEPLVIPMLGSKTWHDRIVNKVDADIFEPKPGESGDKQTINENMPEVNVKIKKEPNNETLNGSLSKQNNLQPMEVTEIKNESGSKEPLSLEEQAAREIIADLNSDGNNKDKQIFTVPIKQENEDDLRGKEESTLEDYENIPITAFGEAMLRGMGWQPGKGIGKDEKVVAPVIPELRPKGMGLGADKRTIQKALQNCKEGKQDLKLVKGSYVKITEGKSSGSYGQVEAFDDDVARVFVKLALGDAVISVNEYWVQPVTSSEYMEKSKVLNLKSYEEHKENEAKKEKDSGRNKKLKREPSPSSSDDDNHKNRRSEKSKKNSKKKHQSSDEESSPDRKVRRKRSSSSQSDEDRKYKKSKKSKKHKNRDSSSERSSRKNRKKDKEREKLRHKKSDYADSLERAKHRDRRKNRSRSRSPRR
ncbi:G-patch domain and KOW motifs-containing protein [Copidosoma floridanum]|uniref:G-patch domain and KOW motifs-containing protein n=1 Tax=Copidosoma floridanum TaxID=29053 RepID=UPI0006C94E9F|nr:G-patch domain and KOW motifs-containing protein [Copidosoma floridanum]